MNYWRNLLRAILKLNKNNTFVFIVLLSYAVVCLSCNTYAEENTQKQKTVIVLSLNLTSFNEFQEISSIKMMMDSGAVALMNTRTAAGNDIYSAYATIGAGSRTEVLSEVYIEKQNNKYSIKNIENIIEHSGLYNAEIGILGDFFHKKKLKIALLGVNKDINSKDFSPGVFIATDKRGTIDEWHIYNELNHYNEDIYRDSTMDFLYQSFEKVYPSSNLIVIDLPETGKNRENFYNRFSTELDSFIYKIKSAIDDDTLLIILSPHFSTYNAHLGRRLTPVVLWGSGIDKGILTSETTRRMGIIGNIDIAPTIVNFFGYNLNGVSGHLTKIINKVDNIDYINSLNDLTAFNYNNRGNILKTYTSFQIFLLLVILLIMFCKFNTIKRIIPVLQSLCLFALSMPLSMLLIPIFKILNIYLFYITILLLNVGITIGVSLISKSIKTKIIIISFITALAISVDIIMGSSLNKTSVLGYDAIIGARYYGIGNEYMGIFVATTLLSLFPLAYRKKINMKVTFVIFMCIIIIIGMPIFGANVGGTITASTAFIFAFLSMKKRSLNYKNVAYGLLLAASLITVFAAVDIFILKQSSHLGQAIMELFSGNTEIIWSIMTRKIQVNIRLLRWTIWSNILIVSLMVMTAAFIKPGKTIHYLFHKYEDFKLSWYSILVGSLFGLVFNDSGVVVAATSNIFLVFSILYLWLGDELHADNGDRLWR